MNQVMLIGRLREKKEIEGICYLEVGIKKIYQNEKGEYEEDIIECIADGGLAKNITEYCQVGSLMGIKGRVENKNGLCIIAEKITFLTSGGNKNENV